MSRSSVQSAISGQNALISEYEGKIVVLETAHTNLSTLRNGDANTNLSNVINHKQSVNGMFQWAWEGQKVHQFVDKYDVVWAALSTYNSEISIAMQTISDKIAEYHTSIGNCRAEISRLKSILANMEE